MRLRIVVALVVVLGLGACASPGGSASDSRPWWDADYDDEPAIGPGYAWEFEFQSPDGTVLTSPRITAYASRRFNISVITRMDFRSQWHVDDAGRPQAVTDTVGVGLLFDAVSSPRDDGTVALRYSLRNDSVVEPFAEEEREVAGHVVTVQRPETLSRNSGGTLRVLPGRRAAIAAFPTRDGAGVVTLWGKVAVVSAQVMAENQRLAKSELADR